MNSSYRPHSQGNLHIVQSYSHYPLDSYHMRSVNVFGVDENACKNRHLVKNYNCFGHSPSSLRNR